jgi:RND family efflux transporter MFP subunit
MKPWIKWTAAGLMLALLAAGTLRTLSARKTKQAALEAQQIAQKTQVSIDLLPTDVVQVQNLDMTLSVALAGPIVAVNTAWVKARVAGELQGLSVRAGDFVKVDQVLGHIDPTESTARLNQAQQQAQAAKAQVDIALRSHENNQALVVQGFISSTALASSQANLAATQANYAAAQAAADVATKSLSDTTLRAPLAGQVAQKLAQNGERVAIDARLVEIVDLSHLELEAALSASDAVQVKVGQKAQLKVEGTPQPVAAQVVRINPSVSTGSRAVLVYLSIDAGSALRQGLFAEGSLATSTQRTLAVPLSAMRTDKPKPYVQSIQDKQVQHLVVELGQRSESGGQTQVAIAGVPAGTRLIAGTVGVLREGTLVNVTVPAPETR